MATAAAIERMPDWPQAMGPDMAAAYCSLSKNTFEKWAKQHKVDPFWVGKRKLYAREDLDGLIKKVSNRRSVDEDWMERINEN